MKNIYKTFLIALVLIAGFTSCEESDLAIDNLYDNVDTSGAILRFLEAPDLVVNLSGEDPYVNTIDFLLEVQEGDGSFLPDFKEVRISYETYANSALDEPVLDFDGNIIGEIYYTTIPAVDFDRLSEINGLPETDYSIQTQVILDIFPTADFPDTIYVKTIFELEMTDGRIFNIQNAGTSLSGPFFSSPFFRITVFRQNL